MIEHNGHTIEFNKEKHTYTLDGIEELTSVTTFISQFFPEFDAIGMAKKLSINPKKKKYFGRNVEDILKEWKEKSDKGKARGTAIHKFIEDFINKKVVSTTQEEYKNYYKVAADLVIELEKDYNIIATEKILFSPDLKISGTFDVLLEEKITGDLVIGDWKTNEEISMSNFFEKGLYPISHLDASDWSKYCLQLNIYEHLLEVEGYYPYIGYKKKLFHIMEDKFQIYDVPDMLGEVRELFKEHKRNWR